MLLPVENGHGRKGVLIFRQKINSGGTSFIYAGVTCISNIRYPVAFKVVKEKHRDLLLKEYMIMRSVWHENILRVWGIYFSVRGSVVIMRMNLAYHRDLYSYISTMEGYATEYLLDKWMRELVSAISHVHISGYIHGNLNYENVLLTKDLSIKVADFGSADKKDTFRLTRYDPMFVPPELKFRLSESIPHDYNPCLIDIWGVGVVLFFALTKHLPFTEVVSMSATDVHGNCPGDTLLYQNDRKQCSASYVKVVSKLMDYNAGRRPQLFLVICQNYFDEPQNEEEPLDLEQFS